MRGVRARRKGSQECARPSRRSLRVTALRERFDGQDLSLLNERPARMLFARRVERRERSSTIAPAERGACGGHKGDLVP